MSLKENKAVVRHFINEVQSQHKLDSVEVFSFVTVIPSAKKIQLSDSTLEVKP